MYGKVGKMINNEINNSNNVGKSFSLNGNTLKAFEVPKVIKNYDEYSDFTQKIGKSTELTDEQKLAKLHEAYDNLLDKTDINVPSDIQYLKGLQNGEPQITIGHQN